MKITYDPDADALYIYLEEDADIENTKKVDENTILDYDKAGKIIGIELLFVKETRPELLKRVKVENLRVASNVKEIRNYRRIFK